MVDILLAFSKASLTTTAADISAGEAETQAKQIELAAIQREADRKGRLASALASQIASAGARGIAAFEGSPLTILQADIEAEERATERDVFQTRLAALTTRTRGRVSQSLLKQQAKIGLASDIVQIGQQRAAAAAGATA